MPPLLFLIILLLVIPLATVAGVAIGAHVFTSIQFSLRDLMRFVLLLNCGLAFLCAPDVLFFHYIGGIVIAANILLTLLFVVKNAVAADAARKVAAAHSLSNSSETDGVR